MDYDDYNNMEEVENEELTSAYDDSERYNKRPMQPNTTRKRIEVEEVLGTGSAEVNKEVCIPLCPPAFEILDDLIKRTIEFDELVATKGKVFVNARLIKNIPYKTRVKVNFPKCSDISKIVFGNIKHVTIEVPFSLCIDIPEARKGNKVVVLDTDIDSVEIPKFEVVKTQVTTCDPCAVSRKEKIIRALIEKDCITVTVKVVKDNIILVDAKDVKDF